MSRALEGTSSIAHRRSTLRRAFELSGVVPLLAFVTLHLVDALQSRVAAPGSYSAAFELGLVWLPLLFHLGCGAWFARTGATARSASVLARVAAWASCVFVAVHAWQTRVPVLRGELRRDLVPLELMSTLSSTVLFGVPAWAGFYMVGIAATSLHVGHGLMHFFQAEGLLRRHPLARLLRIGAWVLAASVFAMGFDAITLLATGTHFWLAPPGGSR
ncbi:MAG: hypothetical protein R3B13_33920 [Polyangiaceae bacterium]